MSTQPHAKNRLKEKLSLRFQDKSQEIFSLFLTIFVKFVEIYFILALIYSLIFYAFLSK